MQEVIAGNYICQNPTKQETIKSYVKGPNRCSYHAKKPNKDVLTTQNKTVKRLIKVVQIYTFS